MIKELNIEPPCFLPCCSLVNAAAILSNHHRPSIPSPALIHLLPTVYKRSFCYLISIYHCCHSSILSFTFRAVKANQFSPSTMPNPSPNHISLLHPYRYLAESWNRHTVLPILCAAAFWLNLGRVCLVMNGV